MSLAFELDRTSPVPLYHQLAQQLELAVQSGNLKPGDRIDPEVEIAERTGLSRPTVRQAIQELVRKGLLVRRRGVGTQVVHGALRRPVELSSLHDDLIRADHHPATTVLSFAVAGAEQDIARHLNVAPGSPVYAIARVRFDGVQPLALMRNWIPADLLHLERIELETNGLYQLLRRAGVQLHVANQQIGATVATAAQARTLGIKPRAALLTMARTTFDDTGRTVEWATSVYRADLYSYETTLIAR